ncbi:MAG: hypothetical protein ACOYJK_02820 [Prevotella sp.]|jgi:VIT1/CCC1 family predicted Fe2+/Mn2+ transporter
MDNDNLQLRHRRRGEENAPHDSSLKLRNWLNAIFMIGAIVGILIYFFGDQTIGTIVILAAMVFKIVEAALRFLH